MSNATLTQLPGDFYPWRWALRIQSADADKFHAFIDDLKYEVLPRNRKWDGASKRWLLKADEAETVVWLLGKHGFSYEIEQEEGERRPAHRQLPMNRTEAAKALYLLPEAPGYVVQAVYRAMAKHLHPDAGGSNEAMQVLNAAVEVLRESTKEG